PEGERLLCVLWTNRVEHQVPGSDIARRCRNLDAVIQGRDVGRVGAASRISRQANARGIYFLAREKIIESPHAVPNGIPSQMIAHQHALRTDNRMLSG